MVVFTQSRGIRSTRNTRNTDPFKPRSDESLAFCHPYLQLRYSVRPHRPACAQQDGEIGVADRCRSVGIKARVILEFRHLGKRVCLFATVVMLCAW